MKNVSKLTEKERIVFAHLSLQAQATVPQIAKQTALREHTVRYVLSSLRNDNVITYVPFIDIGRLGLSDCCVYFNHLTEHPGMRERLIKAICASPEVGYFVELTGEFQYAVAVYGQRIHNLDRFFSRIAGECGGSILDRSYATRLSWSFFPPKFWLNKRPKVRELLCESGNESEAVRIDETDHVILKAIAGGRRFLLRETARTCGLPVSTVESRLKSLKSRGILRGHLYKLAPPYPGLHKFRILITFLTPNTSLRDTLYEFSKNHRHITSFVHCLGNWDIEISVELEDPTKFPAVVQEVSELCAGNISKQRTMTLLTHHKVNLYPFDNLPTVEIKT